MKIFLTLDYLVFFSGKYVTTSFYKKMLKNIGVNLKLNVNVTPTFNTFVTCTCHVIAWCQDNIKCRHNVSCIFLNIHLPAL